MRLWLPAVLALAALPSCGDDDARGGGGGGAGGAGASLPRPSAEQVAAARGMAEKDCAAWQRCLPDNFATFYPDAPSCVDDVALFWAAQLFAAGSDATLDSAAQCGADLDLSSCDAWWRLLFTGGPGACQRTGSTLCEEHRLWFFGDAPPSCKPRGPRVPGDGCAANSQCTSGLCFFGQDPGRPCGTCQFESTADGDPCSLETATMCSGGLECLSERCGALGDLGAPCQPHGCLPHLACFAGTCRARAESGKACDPTEYQGVGVCRPDAVCNAETSTCEPRTHAAEGEHCGALDGGGVADCEPGAACAIGTTVSTAQCVPRLALGQPCGSGFLFGDGCAFPGECIEGICQLRGQTRCE